MPCNKAGGSWLCCGLCIGRILLKSACDGNLLGSMQLGDEGRVERVLIGKYFLKYIRRTVFKSCR